MVFDRWHVVCYTFGMAQKKEYHDLALYDRRIAEYLGNPSSASLLRDVMDD